MSGSNLPVPSIMSGKHSSLEIVGDGSIDFNYVLHFWVHPMVSDNGPIYAPCVVFLDQTWLMIGAIGTLQAARTVCHRWGSIHDKPVLDKTRPQHVPLFNPEETIVDLSVAELGFAVPGDPWHFDESTFRYKLNLAALGVEFAMAANGGSFEDKVEDVEEASKKFATDLRSCAHVPPHLVQAYAEITRKAAIFWLSETEEITGDGVETDDDYGRALADVVRKSDVTYKEAFDTLANELFHFYSRRKGVDGKQLQCWADRCHSALEAGTERLQYFAKERAN